MIIRIEICDKYYQAKNWEKPRRIVIVRQNSGSSFEYIIKYVGKYNSKEQYDNIIIKSLGNGQNLMLKDVAKVMGGKNYSMRIWLDPNKLAAYGLNPTDVTAAINEQSREAAAGSIGQNSGSSFEYIMHIVTGKQIGRAHV